MDGTVTAYMSPDDPLAHDDILMEFDATAAPAILTRRWAHSDSVDEPLGFEAYNTSGGAGTGTERAVFADRQGSVVWVADPATGDVVAAYEYDGFGQLANVVRRQSFWFQRLRNLSEYLAYFVGFIMRRTCGVASVEFREFCV